MKKAYLLFTLLFISILSYSQNLAVNGGFENWTGGVLDTWTSESGTTIEQYEPFSYEGEYSAKFTLTTQTQGVTDLRQTINVEANKVYTVSVKVHHLDTESNARLYVDGFQTFSNETLVDEWQTLTYVYTALETGAIEIGLRFYDVEANWTGTGSEMYIDNYEVIETGEVTEPQLNVPYPIDGSTVPTSYDIVYLVNNFDIPADGYIELRINGNLISELNAANSGNIAIGSFVGTDVITLELLDAIGNSLNPQVIKTITVTVAPTTDISSLADLRVGTVGGFYRYTGEAFLMYQQNLRNQKYMQDEVNGIVTGIKIDDPNGFIVNDLTGFELWGLSQIVGQLTEFHGVLQLEPFSSNLGLTPPGSISVEQVNFNDLLTNWEAYESELVDLFPSMDQTVSFVGITPGELFEEDTNYTITDGTNNLTFRTLFPDADYIGTQIPATLEGMVAIVSEYDGVPQVTARELLDFINPTLSVEQFDDSSFFLSPNPATTQIIINLDNGFIGKVAIAIHDILGKQIYSNIVEKNNTSFSENIDVSRLSSGIYILNLSQDDKFLTKKIIKN